MRSLECLRRLQRLVVLQSVEQLGELDDGEDPLQGRFRLDHGGGEMVRLEPDHEISGRQRARNEDTSAVVGQIDAEVGRGARCLRQDGHTAGVLCSHGANRGLRGQHTPTQDGLGERAPSAIPRTDEDDLEPVGVGLAPSIWRHRRR